LPKCQAGSLWETSRQQAHAFLPFVSLPLAALLLVAVFTVHLPYGFSTITLTSVTAGRAQFGPPGFECDLLYLACLVTLVLAGSGPLGIDEYLRTKAATEMPRRPSEG
jgi:putative oxidoreductase